MKYLAISLILAATIGILFSVVSYAKDSETVQEISVEDAMEAWQKQEVVFIDVRTVEEYNQGHVPGALLLPLAELENRLDEVTTDTKVLIICRSGNRSGKANIILQKNGSTNTYSVRGGMLAWKEAVEKEE
jgi:rhodanese-related sulfurtransferase